VTLALAYLTGPKLDVLSITVANDNDYAVRVNSTGLVTQDGTRRDLVFLDQLPGASLPGSIPPHDEGMAFLERSAAEQDGIDFFRPLVAWANVASVGRFESKPATIFVR
jgi:hypothetical protein